MRHLTRPALVLLGVLVLLGAARWAIPRMFNQVSVAVQDRNIPVGTLLGVGGHSNVPQDVQVWESRQAQYTGAATCTQCHQEKVTEWAVGQHASVPCETCHGIANEHIQTEAPLTADTSSALCTLCHSTTLGRPGSFPQVDVHEHSDNLKCVSCHNPHSPEKSIPVIPHLVVGNTGCLACHRTAQVVPLPQSHTGRSENGCLSCHQEAPPTPQATAAAPVRMPPSLSHPVTGHVDCLACHGTGGFVPFPEDHARWEETPCLLCHKGQ